MKTGESQREKKMAASSLATPIQQPPGLIKALSLFSKSWEPIPEPEVAEHEADETELARARLTDMARNSLGGAALDQHARDLASKMVAAGHGREPIPSKLN